MLFRNDDLADFDHLNTAKATGVASIGSSPCKARLGTGVVVGLPSKVKQEGATILNDVEVVHKGLWWGVPLKPPL